MGQIVYRFSGSTFNFLESPFGEVLGEEIYGGEIGARSNGEMGDVLLERGTRLPVPILALRSKITTTMRRTQRHVREGGKQFYVVWLIEKGQVSISCANGTKIVAPNHIMITNSGDPFYIEALIGNDKEHRNKLALVPAHLLHANLPEHGQLNTMSFSTLGEDGKVVAGLINLLFETGDGLERDDASAMLGLLLRALGRLVGAETGGEREHRSMLQVRLAQIRAYIDLHLANPQLTLAEVARMCGISTRYLAKIMRNSGTCFAEMLRDRRIGRACQWLSAPDKREYPIAEVARIVGFGSGAQLSKTFRARLGCTPRDYRRRAAEVPGID